MKVTVSKNEYKHIELIVRKRKKIIAVSTLADNSVSLETYHLLSDLVAYDLSLLAGSGLSVGWSEKGVYIVDFRDDLDTEKVDTLVEGHRISTHKFDKMNCSLDLVVYYVPNTKEENNISIMKSK
jgi:hypothetical protein